MKKKFWSTDKIIGLSALFMSLCTLIVFVYQTNLIRKQQYMSVYPHLDTGNFNSGSLIYTYKLVNKGVGPAFIKAINVEELNGKKYPNLKSYVRSKVTAKDSISFYYSDIAVGQLISANEEIDLFELTEEEYTKTRNLPSNDENSADRLWDILNSDSLKFEIKYESIYGESWSIYNKSSVPVKH